MYLLIRPQAQTDYQDVHSQHDQLASVFTDIFNPSLTYIFQADHHSPCDQESLNDYSPVALTSVAMICFERLVMAHIITIIPETLAPLQIA